MFHQDRTDNRRVFIDAWRKAGAGEPLTDMERRIADLMARHPEYRAAWTEDALDQDWLPELGDVNPFLHLGLHLAVLEQLAIDQPKGIRRAFRTLLDEHFGDQHAAEHQVMDCLAEMLWRTQREGQPYRPKAYLKCLHRGGGLSTRG